MLQNVRYGVQKATQETWFYKRQTFEMIIGIAKEQKTKKKRKKKNIKIYKVWSKVMLEIVINFEEFQLVYDILLCLPVHSFIQ